MAKFKRTRTVYRKAKRHVKRHSGFTGGLMGGILAGAAVGLGVKALAPHMNQYIPSVAGISSVTLGTLGGGIVVKHVLRKDPMKIASAAIILGSAMAASELMGNFGMGGSVGTAQAAGAYANDQ